MKKRKLFFLIVLFILVTVPYIVYAGCANCGSGGGGTGVSNSNSGGCNVANCTQSQTGGFRITMYTYDGSGTPTKIGSSVDLLASNFVVPYLITSPVDSDVLKDRNSNSCNVGHNGYSLSGYTTMDWSTYSSSDEFDYYIIDHWANVKNTDENVANYLGNTSTGTGWLYTNVFNKLADGNYADVASMFHTTEEEIKENSDSIYFVAELITEIKVEKDSTDIYAGTVSEISTNVVMTNFINLMYISDGFLEDPTRVTTTGRIGELVGYSTSSRYIKAVELLTIDTYYTGFSSSLCGKAYGLAVWHLAECCPTCGTQTCSSACSSYEEGSAGRELCAKSWCETNDPDNEDCVSSCNTTDNEGCDPSNYNTCVTYTDSSGETTEYEIGATCSTDTSTGTSAVTLSTKTCFDDGSEYTSTSTKYYKIECTETEELSELPGKLNVYVNSSGSANLYLGYTKTYSKTCTLYWRADPSKVTDSNWTTNYDDSLLKSSISEYEEIKDGNIEGSNIDEETKEEMIEEATTIYAELTGARAIALARLVTVTSADYKLEGEDEEDTATITYATSSTTTETETLEMTPVYCFDIVNTDINYCTLESNTWTKTTTTDLYCTDDASIGVIVTDTSTESSSESSSGSSSSGNGSGNVATTTTTIYYSIPSSYVVVFSKITGTTYRTLSACADAAGSEDLCNELEYTYAFNKITIPIEEYNELISEGGYTLTITGDGMCSQFSYDLDCTYVLKDNVLYEDEYDDSDSSSSSSSKESGGSSSSSSSTTIEGGVITGGDENSWSSSSSTTSGKDDDGDSDDDSSSNSSSNSSSDSSSSRTVVDCDDYCGSNIVCRAKYCPTECDGCDEKDSEECDDVTTCEKTYCSGYSGDEYTLCKYDTCCSGECGGNIGCIYKCCTAECEELYTSDDDIATCKAGCECPNGVCEDEYYYRVVNRGEPFPEDTHVTGENWSGNETYITEESGVTDATNDTSSYEYKIELSSSDVSAIRNQTTYNTVYTDYGISEYASSVTSTNGDVDEYCSAFLYDYLYTTLGVNIDKSDDVGNKGCVIGS